MRRILAVIAALCFASLALAQGLPGGGQAGIPAIGAVSPSGSLTTTPATIVNADADYGAKGDFNQGRGASITAGANVLSGGTTTCNASADTGKTILIPGAGTGGAALNTTISGCSGSSYTLAVNATYSANASNYWVGYSGVQVQSDGTGCSPGDVLTLTGGTASLQGAVTVNTCQVHSASVNAAGSGGTTGGCVLIDAGTFTGEPFRIYATVASGSITALGAFIHRGDYTGNPSNLSAEPVSGCGLSGSPTLTLTMGVSQQVDPGSGVTVSSPGSYTAYPASPVAVGSSTGSESGETFNVYFPYGGIYSYGTNNYTAFNNALVAATRANTAFGGGIVQMGCTGKYLISGGSLTIGYFNGGVNSGPLVTLQQCYHNGDGGGLATTMGPASSGLYFDTTGGNTINVKYNGTLQNTQIFNPLISYGYQSEPFRPMVNRNNSFSGTAAITMNGSSAATATSLSQLLILGYSTGIYENGQADFKFIDIKGDDINLFNIVSVYGYALIRDANCTNFLIATGNGAGQANQSISAITNNGGNIQITTSSPTQFQVGDQVYVTKAGNIPNEPVSGYPAANGIWRIGQVIDASNYVLAGSTASGTQTYTSGGTIGWYPTHWGTCLFFNGISSGSDGLWVEDFGGGGNWLNGIHLVSGQGIHLVNTAGNGFGYDPIAIGIWFDGTLNNSDISGGTEWQQYATPFLDTVYSATPIPNKIIGGQFFSNGYGYSVQHLGSLEEMFEGYAGNRTNGVQAIYIGDGAGQLLFSGSDLTNVAFNTQSYADWAKLTIDSGTIGGGNTSFTLPANPNGAFVIPPAPINALGQLTSGTKNPLGVCDVAPVPTLCFGMRRELSTYTGPIVNVTRASDSVTLALRQDNFGNIDQSECISFQGTSTLSVNTWYNQTGSVNFTQTGALQPIFSCNLAAMGGRPGIIEVNGTNTYLNLASNASWQGWAAGASAGSVLLTLMPTGSATNNDRIFADGFGGGAANTLAAYIVNGGTTVQFTPAFSTTVGVWTTSGTLSTTVPTVLDFNYQWTATTNVPIVEFNGTSQNFGSSTTPVGTAGSDSGWGLTLGGVNSATTTLSADIETFVMWTAGPGAAQIEQARKAEGAYYGVTIN